jgi:amino acid transporter
MIEFEIILFIMAIGFASLITTLVLCLTGKKIDAKNKMERQIFEVNFFNFKLKLVPFLYLLIVFIVFVIGIFSDFLVNSIVGLIIALIPFTIYWIFDRRNLGVARE